jgi:hypothetical protein
MVVFYCLECKSKVGECPTPLTHDDVAYHETLHKHWDEVHKGLPLKLEPIDIDELRVDLLIPMTWEELGLSESA